MKYSITFYCYKLEENILSISISKKDNEYLLTETYMTYPLDACIPAYEKETLFIYYIPMLYYLLDIFDDFYKEHITYMPYTIDKLPPTYYITDICELSINQYIMMANNAQIEMGNSLILYNNIIEDIKSKLNKTKFRLLLIKIEKENIKSLQTLFIVSDLIFEFL